MLLSQSEWKLVYVLVSLSVCHCLSVHLQAESIPLALDIISGSTMRNHTISVARVYDIVGCAASVSNETKHSTGSVCAEG